MSCTATPSPSQAGANQCTWNRHDSTCTLTPPPTDIIFTIIVSLVTLLLGIPPSIFVTILLDEYASKWPGKVEGEEELAKFAMNDAAADSESPGKTKEHEDFDEDCHQSTDFGKAMRKASLLNQKSMSQSNIIKDATMYTYCNGKYITQGVFGRPKTLHFQRNCSVFSPKNNQC